MASSTYWKLRRLAPRAIRVIERRRGESGVLEAYAGTLIPKAEAFISAYDESGKYGAAWRKEMDEGRGAIKAVLDTMRSWLPLVQRDVPGFEGRDFGDKPDVPDDVIEDAGRFFDIVADYQNDAGEPLKYQDNLLQKLEPALQSAIKEWGEAESADKKYQSLLASMRQTAQAFDDDLKPFRRSLAVVAGRSDKDYQKLRAQKAQTSDEDDDAASPAPPSQVTSADAGVTQPVD